MELPIDHFRLLGVSPSVETDGILRTLELRLDRPPQEGFTQEALIHRAELLRRSAEILSNQNSREEYEAALLSGALGLELTSKREVAGLLLLLESEAPLEAFKLACRALKPPQTPALGSGREADLTLIAALSCRAASLQEQEERHYESAAQLLGEGLQLLQRMGKLPEQRESIEKDLDSLLPYRILDLVSRDLGDQSSHQEGIRLFDDLVIKRGGLEGKNIKNEFTELKQPEFEIFFHQIRKFLTIQEQLDLFSRWQKIGSLDAAFLKVLALVADGFIHRKPERIKEARKNLKNIDLQGLDQMPLLGCMDLLLADISLAEQQFLKSDDKGLTTWLSNYPGEFLEALCEYCTDWLRKDVLLGFRDVDSVSIDLEAWFGDRDVQSYIEKLDSKGAKGIAKAGFALLSSISSDKDQIEEVENSYPENNDELVLSLDKETDEDIIDQEHFDGDIFLNENLQALLGKVKLQFNNKNKSLSYLFLSLIFLASIAGVFLLRNRRPSNVSLENQTLINDINDINDQQRPIEEEVEADSLLSVSEDNIADNTLIKTTLESPSPLIKEIPNKDEIRSIIESWLLNKSNLLAGEEDSFLPIIAREPLVRKLEEERRKDSVLGQIQEIKATVESLDIVSQTVKRIEVKAKISYEDKKISELGEVISETKIPSLSVTYIFGREKELWQLVDYISGS